MLKAFLIVSLIGALIQLAQVILPVLWLCFLCAVKYFIVRSEIAGPAPVLKSEKRRPISSRRGEPWLF